MIIIAHTQCDNVSERSGACFHNGAISAGQCFRTNSNDDDSYSRCFRPFEDTSSKDLHRLGCISNEWLINFRTFWTGTYFGAAFQTTVQESETVRADLFFIPFFMRGSPQNDHLFTVCILRYVQIQKYAARSHCLADRTPSAWHRSRNPRLRLCLVLLGVLSRLIFHVRLVTEDGGGAPVDDLINEYLEQMKRKDKVDGELVHGTNV